MDLREETESALLANERKPENELAGGEEKRGAVLSRRPEKQARNRKMSSVWEI